MVVIIVTIIVGPAIVIRVNIILIIVYIYIYIYIGPWLQRARDGPEHHRHLQALGHRHRRGGRRGGVQHPRDHRHGPARHAGCVHAAEAGRLLLLARRLLLRPVRGHAVLRPEGRRGHARRVPDAVGGRGPLQHIKNYCKQHKETQQQCMMFLLYFRLLFVMLFSSSNNT